MPYIDPDVIAEAKQMDLFTYLQNYEPQELVHFSGNVYCTRTHDSLKISNGKWCWFSRGIGGRSALDYLIKVRDMKFTEAVEQIMGRTSVKPSAITPAICEQKPIPFILPPKDNGIAETERYLMGRGINRELISYCAGSGMLYQSCNSGYVNAVFVGYDKDKTPRYATIRGTRGSFKGDVSGSNKSYSFALSSGSENLHLFESVVDLLSFATLEGIRTQGSYDGDLLSLSGVYKPRKKIEESSLPPALAQYLKDHPDIRRIHLHLDNDLAGRLATQAIMTILPKQYAAMDEPPLSGKDYNDFACDRLGLLRTKPREKER